MDSKEGFTQRAEKVTVTESSDKGSEEEGDGKLD